MKIAFFLIPKREVVYLSKDDTVRQALEKMEHHRYMAVPVLDEDGKYVGTLTEGDLLWKLKNTPELSFKNAENLPLEDVPRQFINATVGIDVEIEALVSLAIDQNFIPVVDDQENFIGIIRRREIIEYLAKHQRNEARQKKTHFSNDSLRASPYSNQAPKTIAIF